MLGQGDVASPQSGELGLEVRVEAVVRDDFDVTERTIRQTTLTGSVAVGLDWAEEQQLQASWLYLRNTEDEASLTVGNNFNFQADSGSQLRNYRIRFEERELEVLQLSGRHKLGGATLDVLGKAAEDVKSRSAGMLDQIANSAKANT